MELTILILTKLLLEQDELRNKEIKTPQTYKTRCLYNN